MSEEATVYEPGDSVYTLAENGEARQYKVQIDGTLRLWAGSAMPQRYAKRRTVLNKHRPGRAQELKFAASDSLVHQVRVFAVRNYLGMQTAIRELVERGLQASKEN